MARKNLNRDSIENVLKEDGVSKKLNQLSKVIAGDVRDTLDLKDDERLQEIIDGINNNKGNNGGMPKGTIESCGYTINIDDVLNGLTYEQGNDKVTHGNMGPIIKGRYEQAINNLSGDEKDKMFNKATKTLAGIVLLFIIELEKKSDVSGNETTTEKSDKMDLDPNKIYKEIKGRYEELPEFNFDKLVIRNRVAKQISDLRKNKGESSELKNIKGEIALRDGVTFDLNDPSFKEILNFYGNQYKDADDKKREELDTMLAERIILHCGYYIQINDSLKKSDPNYVSSYVPQLNNCREGLKNIKLDVVGEHIKHQGKDYLVVRLNGVTPETATPPETTTPPETATPPETTTPPETATPPETTTPPENATPPETTTPPENATPPETTTPPENATPPETTTPPENATPPETTTPPENATPPETTTPPENEEDVIFEENVVLSDVSESYEDMISREVENEINEEWHNTSKFNIFKRLNLFLRRGRIRKNKIKSMKKSFERTPFTSNGVFNAEMGKQASRHDLEEILGGKGVKRDAFGKIDRKNMIAAGEVSGDPLYETARGKEFRQMCQDYVAGTISQIEFQNRFNNFVRVKLGLPKEQQFVATNVLEKLDAIRNDNELLKIITKELEDYLKPNDHKISHFDTIRKRIDDDFKKYRRDPRFRKEIMDIIGDTTGLTKEQLDKKIEKFMRHQKALAKMSTQNLQIKLDLLTNGKGAYQTNNKDRENWLFRFGNKLDKMPRWGQALTIAGISASGIAVGLLGGSALAATATVSGLVGAKNFVKKWTHHTKEQNTYEKNLTRNYDEEIAQMKERERIRDEKDSQGKYTHGWFKRYKAKRQLELYGKTTQSELQNENTGNTKELSDFIYAALERYNSLNPDEKNALNCTLLDAKARLEVYRAKGHNFLKSKDKNQIERDFYDLENALNLSANRILGTGTSFKDISLINAHDASGKVVNYNDLLNLYKKDYDSASKKFKGERAWLATKWGLSTAAITFGTAAATQAITGTGMFAKDAVAGTPGTPDSLDTTNTGTVTDYYGSGRYELVGGNKIFNAAQDNIAGLDSSSSVTLHLGAGTNGDPVRAGSALLNYGTYTAKLDQVKDVIAHSSLSNKADLISQLDKGFSTSGFTNTNLHGMRCLEAIEETVKGAGNFAGNLNISYDTALDIDSSVLHEASSRMSQAFLEISKVIPGKPGTEAIEGGAKWLVVGLPWFSNTFKRKNDGKTPERPVEQPVNNGDEKGKDKGDEKGKDKGDDKWKDNGNGKGKDKGDEKGKDKGDEKGKDKGDEKGKDKGDNKGQSSAIVIPPVKSDERDEIKEDTDNKAEEINEELKNNVKTDLYDIFNKDYMGESEYKEKYKDSPWALKKLEEAKDFWKRFPKLNFYDTSVVDSLKEEFKDNDYILSRIKKELNTKLDSEFQHYLGKTEIDKYKDKANTLVDSALSNKDYAKDGIRPMIIIKVSDDLTIPFYISSGWGNKPGVPTNKFYPIFGIGSDGWLNKGRESEINNYYGSPLLAAIAKELNKRYEGKKIDVSGWGNSDEKFKEMANLGKNPVPYGKGRYDNINETLKKISKI